MIIKNKKELEILREGGKRLARVLRAVADATKPGISTKELDALAEKLIRESGGTPSFKNYEIPMAPTAYPGTLCVSVNEEVVHGIPSDRLLREGDVVGLDIGMLWPSEALAKEAGYEEGFYTDTATTVVVGGGSVPIVDATKQSLERGIAEVKSGARIGDVGYAIQNFLEKQGFGVVRELVGHGVGRAVHEDPEIPNWGKPGEGDELFEDLVIAIEPMATEGSPRVKLLADGWTWATRDGSRSAHFEHTLIVTKNGAEVITQ